MNTVRETLSALTAFFMLIVLLLTSPVIHADPNFMTSETPSATPQVITGTLLDSATNEPVPGIMLCVFRDDGDYVHDAGMDNPANCVNILPEGTFPTLTPDAVGSDTSDSFVTEIITDDRGNFVLRGLPPGGYWLVHGDEIFPIDPRFYSLLVPFYFEMPTQNHLMVYLFRNGIIWGDVLIDNTERLASDVSLCIFFDNGDEVWNPSPNSPPHCAGGRLSDTNRQPPYDTFVEEVSTDSTGRFTLPDVPGGFYWITGTRDWFPPEMFAEVRPLLVSIPLQKRIIIPYNDGFLPVTTLIEGQVRDRNCNQPAISGIMLCLFRDDGDRLFDPESNTPNHCSLGFPETQPLEGNDNWVTEIISDHLGIFSLYNLTDGIYWLILSDPTVHIEIIESTEPYLLEVPLEGELIFFTDAYSCP